MQYYNVRRISDSSTTIDWSKADLLIDFCFPWEEITAPATQFRALWSSTHLHFRFDCLDEDLVLAEAETLKERVLGSDRVEIFFTPELSLNPYYCFEMSPKAEVLAYQARHHRQIDWNWTCPDMQVSAEIKDTGYWLEGSLPIAKMQELGILKPDSLKFFTGIYRGEFSHLQNGEIKMGWISWVNSKTTKPDFHIPESFGVFELRP